MAKFEFRLAKVLEYREMEESWAKAAYLEAKAAKISCEAGIVAIIEKRTQLLGSRVFTIEDRLTLEGALVRTDDEERAERAVLSVLEGDELAALDAWHSKRRELQTLMKLEEAALDLWTYEQNRIEQNELDEWATMRKAA